MRLLFDLDKKDYAACTHRFERPSARSVIIRDGKLAMIYSGKYGYYKFPGGGIEPGEDPAAAMIRETLEEAGLRVDPASVRPYGYVHRIQRSDRDPTECFVQDNFYFLCEALGEPVEQRLDGYEAEEDMRLRFVEPETVLRTNRGVGPSPYNGLMFEREARVVELLLKEGYFG